MNAAFSLLGRRLPGSMRRFTVVLAPGASRDYRVSEWRGALIVLEHGRLELETLTGGRSAFDPGAVLTLSGLPLRAMHNPGDVDAVLVGVAVGRTDSFPDAVPSHR